MRRRGKLLLAALSLVLCPLFMAGSAQGATLTIGSQFQGTITEITPLFDGTAFNTALPSPPIAASPVDGTVISWRFYGDGSGFVPRVVRQVGPDLYTGAGTGPAQSASSAIAGPFPLSLPIKRGNYFGFDLQSGNPVGRISKPGASFLSPSPPLVDGGPGATAPGNPGFELAVGATVRYCLVPKLRGKKPKAARAALAAADCAVGSTRKSKKRRKKKKVLSQSVVPGTSISDTQPVDIKVSRKRR